MSARPFETLLAGCGAIGSRLTAAVPAGTMAFTFADQQRVAPENVGVAAYGDADVGAAKAAVLRARWRGLGGEGRALPGDVRYTVRPGLIDRLDAVVACLDNATAIRDLTAVVWSSGSAPLPVLALTCGGEAGGYQARLFVRPGTCAVCLFGIAERQADEIALGASCVDTSAPRASAAAAEAAAVAGATMLARWLAGDRSLVNARLQCDPGSPAYVVHMPPAPSPGCPVSHLAAGGDTRVEDVGSTIAAVAVGTLAERALASAGDDAEILLERRAIARAGLYCSHCRATAPAALLLLPAAVARWSGCGCGAPLRPLGTRATIPARELLESSVASLTLAAWGAGHGDAFAVVGRLGRIRLRCAFNWGDLDAVG
jgi:hypothetical protein